MYKAIIGKKLGMSQIFTPDGKVIPVTVVEAGPCPVVSVKTGDRDGYTAVQMAFGDAVEKKTSKPVLGQYKKAGIEVKRHMREFRVDDPSEYKVGDEIKCTVFAEGDRVDVAGTSRGRGFSGVIQRWNAHRVGPMSHGTGPIHRSPGSMSANSSPSRVFKNKKLAGQWGSERVTVQNLTIARVDAERNLILIKGGIPGARGGIVYVKETVKG